LLVQLQYKYVSIVNKILKNPQEKGGKCEIWQQQCFFAHFNIEKFQVRTKRLYGKGLGVVWLSIAQPCLKGF
jgi:hypothetical protein